MWYCRFRWGARRNPASPWLLVINTRNQTNSSRVLLTNLRPTRPRVLVLLFSFLILFLLSFFGFIRKRKKWLVYKRRDKVREQWCQYLGWYLQTCSKLQEFFSLLHKYVLFYYYLLLFLCKHFLKN